MQSTLAHAAIMLDCILRVEAVLAWCWHMCPLSVAGERGRWFLINAVVSLRSSAWKSVDAGEDYMIWWM